MARPEGDLDSARVTSPPAEPFPVTRSSSTSTSTYTTSTTPAPLTPSSPPGMTTNRTSKSSSFQSIHSDDGGALDDIGHFENIGLDDDDTHDQDASYKHQRQYHQQQYQQHHSSLPKSPLPANQPRFPSSSASQNASTSSASASASAGRTLASSRRAPLPRRLSNPDLRSNLHNSDPRSTSLTVLTSPSYPTSPAQRSVSNNSTPSLSQSGSFGAVPSSAGSGAGRRRSPSPNYALDPRYPARAPRPRRGSWQSNKRKSFAELEHECDEDTGDDIPDGLILDNVPLSPRPQNERPPSRRPSPSPSPNRGTKERSKERVRSVGNGTPAVAQAQGSLKSPTWKDEAAIAERPSPKPTQSRAHSWNAGLASLSAEARALTEKLEEHADEEEERASRPSVSGRPNTWTSSRSNEYPFDKKERIKSTPDLPPLRKTNVMIDPLPVSKEKEAVLSRTRPSWLPPKNPAEERKHVKQYQKMMAASVKADERREAARRSKTEMKDTTADGYMQMWENDIIPRWNEAIRERKTREMWWRGVPPRSRGTVWLQAIGNELGLSQSSFDAALERARAIEERVANGMGNAEDSRRSHWFDSIRKDASHETWRDLRIFNVEGPLHDNLVDVLMAYAMYRNDIGYVSGSNTIAALLLLNLPSPAAAFVALANMLNRPLPLSFHTSDAGAQSSVYNLVLQNVAKKSTPLHEHLSKSVNSNEDPGIYMRDMFVTLFTGSLAVDEAARLWDVYVFEGDALLVRAATAMLLRQEMALLGCASGDEIRQVLARQTGEDSGKGPTVTVVGAEESFIAAIRDAGKT